MSDGRWHCVVLTRIAWLATVHVDGVADAAGTTPGTTEIFNDSPWFIGHSTCNGLDGTSTFGGELNEIPVFDRALSESEIKAIGDAGSAGVCEDEDGDGFRPPLDCDETDISKTGFTPLECE